MMRWSLLVAIAVGLPLLAAEPKENSVPAALNFEVKSLDGKPVKLSDFHGQVLLVVNVASECGATPQYADLQSLYKEYEAQGLVVLGFPCNQFGAQEPGSATEIKEFCRREYSVTFPMFAKIDVNGDKAAPFYQHLTRQPTKPQGAGMIGWNFEKFLINRAGEVVARYGTGVEPRDPQVVQAIERELTKR